MDFRLAYDSRIELPETPVWDARIQKLYWTDLFSGDVHRFDPATGGDELWQTMPFIGNAIPCDDLNRLLCVAQFGAYLLDLRTGALELIAAPENHNEALRYSDSRVDAAGRIYTSTVALTYGGEEYTPDQTGSFYCIERDGSVKVITEGINQYNTVIWNRDSTRMFVADTYHETLLEYDYNLQDGVTGGPRTVIDFKALGYGMPDGMSMDEQDHLYICHWCGKLSVWDKDLRQLQPIDFPTPQIACGGFGGADMRDFYIASGAWHYNEQEIAAHPGCGGIFVGRSEIPGMPYHFYQTK